MGHFWYIMTLYLEDESSLDGSLPTSSSHSYIHHSVSEMTLPKRRDYRPQSCSTPSWSAVQTPPSTSPSVCTPSSPSSPNDSSRDSAYFSPAGVESFASPEVPAEHHQGWTEAILTALSQCVGGSLSLDGPTTSTAPQTEQEITRFLKSVWENDIPQTEAAMQSLPNRGYTEKIRALREAYNTKLIELASSEQQYLTQVLTARQSNGGQLELGLLRAQIAHRFHLLKQSLDKMAMQAVITIRGSCLESSKKRKNLPQRCTRILNTWFEDHTSHPYPTVKQKQELAAACGLTATQVSTWFSNRRCRINKGTSKAKNGKSTSSKPKH